MVSFVLAGLSLSSSSQAFRKQLCTAFILYPNRGQRPRLNPSIPRGSATYLNIQMSPTSESQTNNNGGPPPPPLQERPILAKLVTSDELAECGARLRAGNLVAFPTETVYGLGCHALDESAIAKVFHAKERPLTDPLIVHVTKTQDAFALWEAFTGAADDDSSTNTTTTTTLQARALQALCDQFWPGPLTLVAKAASHVPSIVMANTGFVACRSPSHPIARALIDEAKVPLAAPSANKFGHVSPTRASHVWDDLLREDVWIIEAAMSSHKEEDDTDSTRDSTVCQVGVESTVAKVEMLEPFTEGDETSEYGRVTLLRQGAISVDDVKMCLAQAGLSAVMQVEANTKRTTDEHTANVAPGQTIRHYSPRIPSFMVAQSLCCPETATLALSPADTAVLQRSVVIDFGARLAAWKPNCLAYRDLSQLGDSSEAANVVFETLRWAEQVPGGQQILFPEIVAVTHDHDLSSTPGELHVVVNALTLALNDRLTRAASGVIIETLEPQ
jgi:L-threonylcarbamoyladenylate synthase